jgi:methyltransferase (TIGR00027 family)
MNTGAKPQLSVSDTAHWIAAIRADESARQDALFRDPYASQLAGPAGRTRPASVPSWPLVTRIKLIDELVLQAVREGADCVLNLAAGLDTRPYRLALPASLEWIEGDLPGIIDYKERALESAQPHCRLSREKIDLADAAARDAFLARAFARCSRAVVITEGLLLYLNSGLVEALGRDLGKHSNACWWITDLLSPALVRAMKRETDPQLAPEARMRFAPENGVGFFRALGWLPREVHSIVRAAATYKRLPIAMRVLRFLPEPKPDALGDKRRWGAVIRCERAPT